MMYKSQFKNNLPLWLVLLSRVTYCFILKQTQYLNELSCVGYGVFGVFSRVSGFACVVFSRDIDAWACDQGKCWSSSHRKQRPPAASSRRSDSHKPLRDDRPKHTHTHWEPDHWRCSKLTHFTMFPCWSSFFPPHAIGLWAEVAEMCWAQTTHPTLHLLWRSASHTHRAALVHQIYVILSSFGVCIIRYSCCRHSVD